MSTPEDITTRFRTEITSDYALFQALARRVEDRQNEVAAVGGPTGIFENSTIPEQADGFDYADMVAAFTASSAMIGAISDAQRAAVIKARRD